MSNIIINTRFSKLASSPTYALWLLHFPDCVESEGTKYFSSELEAVYGKDTRPFLLASILVSSCLIWRFILVLFVSAWHLLSQLFLRSRFYVLRSSKTWFRPLANIFFTPPSSSISWHVIFVVPQKDRLNHYHRLFLLAPFQLTRYCE